MHAGMQSWMDSALTCANKSVANAEDTLAGSIESTVRTAWSQHWIHPEPECIKMGELEKWSMFGDLQRLCARPSKGLICHIISTPLTHAQRPNNWAFAMSEANNSHATYARQSPNSVGNACILSFFLSFFSSSASQRCALFPQRWASFLKRWASFPKRCESLSVNVASMQHFWEMISIFWEMIRIFWEMVLISEEKVQHLWKFVWRQTRSATQTRCPRHRSCRKPTRVFS